MVGQPAEDWVDNGISLEIVSLEDEFRKLNIDPIIVNDQIREFDLGSTIETINDLIRTNYESDELNTVPTCKKGCTSGRFNEGRDCPHCGHPVVCVINQPFESVLWMRVPDGVRAFVHPRMYQVFKRYLGTTAIDMMEWFTNPNYVVSRSRGMRGGKKEVEQLLGYLEEAGVKRGISAFHDNFDEYMNILLGGDVSHLRFKYPNKRARFQVADKLMTFIKMYRDCVFTRYLPFPSKLIMVSERGGNADFIDPNMKDAFDAPKTIVALLTRPIPPSERVMQAETMKVVKCMGSYFNTHYQVTCAEKTGLFRGQHGGTRSFFTGRAVIAPLSLAHDYDEIHTPWTWTVTILSVHLTNKLLRLGYTPFEIFRILDVATVRYTPMIHDLINELIAECPEGGIPVSMLRNPTLRRSSNQLFRITKVLTNTNDNAIMISVLAIKGPNGDFDGDQLQVRLLLDNKEKAQFSRLGSHLSLMNPDRPNQVGGHITWHPEVTTMANNYLSHQRALA